MSTMYLAQFHEKIIFWKSRTLTRMRLTAKSVAKDFLKKGES